MTTRAGSVRLVDQVPPETLEWLTGPDNPAVAVLTRRTLLDEADSPALDALWAARNEYPPVAAILEAVREDGSWDVPARDYQKYKGSLWQILFLGELWADGEDERVRRGAEYAFSRQLEDGSWSATNMRPYGSITCLTANVGRSLARLGFARDERVVRALGYCARMYRRLGVVDCQRMGVYHLNGYCHMLLPKVLLFLAEVPQELWPDGSTELRDECIARLREKEIFNSLPEEAAEFQQAILALPAKEHAAFREQFIAEHQPLHYKAKPGWLRFGYPLSYNSDALESLAALAANGEHSRPEYEPALEVVRQSADERMRWTLQNTHNGKLYGDIESKGKPSKWLTLRALQVLSHFGE